MSMLDSQATSRKTFRARQGCVGASVEQSDAHVEAIMDCSQHERGKTSAIAAVDWLTAANMKGDGIRCTGSDRESEQCSELLLGRRYSEHGTLAEGKKRTGKAPDTLGLTIRLLRDD